MDLPDHLCLDTNCFIYALEDPTGPRGRFVVGTLMTVDARPSRLVTSTLVVAELLARPYALGLPERAARLRRAIESLPGLTVEPVTTAVADAAARTRAELGLGLPDAVVLATARAAGALLVTNDRRLAAAAASSAVLLDDLVEAEQA